MNLNGSTEIRNSTRGLISRRSLDLPSYLFLFTTYTDQRRNRITNVETKSYITYFNAELYIELYIIFFSFFFRSSLILSDERIEVEGNRSRDFRGGGLKIFARSPVISSSSSFRRGPRSTKFLFCKAKRRDSAIDNGLPGDGPFTRRSTRLNEAFSDSPWWTRA